MMCNDWEDEFIVFFSQTLSLPFICGKWDHNTNWRNSFQCFYNTHMLWRLLRAIWKCQSLKEWIPTANTGSETGLHGQSEVGTFTHALPWWEWVHCAIGYPYYEINNLIYCLYPHLALMFFSKVSHIHIFESLSVSAGRCPVSTLPNTVNSTWELHDEIVVFWNGTECLEYRTIISLVCETGHQFADGGTVLTSECLSNETWKQPDSDSCEGKCYST